MKRLFERFWYWLVYWRHLDTRTLDQAMHDFRFEQTRHAFCHQGKVSEVRGSIVVEVR